MFSFRKKENVQFSQKVGVFKEKPRLQYLLPWAFIDEDTGIVHGKDHSLLSIYKFRGPDMDSSTPAELLQYNAALNNVMKKLTTGYVLYFEAQRKIDTNYEQAAISVPLVQKMEDERKDYYTKQRHYETLFYFIIYCEPPQLLKSKITNAFITDAKNKGSNTKYDMKVYFDIVEKFISNVNLVGDMLSKWFKDIEPLSAKETLAYLHTTISTKSFDININPLRYITDYICDCDVLGGREMKLGNKYMKIITVLDFPPVSTPGIFNTFNSLNMEYRWVSRFICMSKLDAQEELQKYRKRWNQQVKGFWSQIRSAITKEQLEQDVDETAASNRDDTIVAQQELGQDAVSYGYYTMTMIVMDENKEKCQEKANKVLEKINSLGFVGFIETDNSMEAWWGSIPGCYRANIRRPIINSLNFCHLAPITAMWSGDKKNKHLKGPVLLYTDTEGYTPFRLSLHVGDVGHTMICGPSGSGKSVLLNTLEAHFLKYPNSNVFIFDKAGSSRALTLAVGGNFYNLAAEGETELSFQPLARVDNEQERKWAKEWILMYLKQKNMTIDPEKEDYVWKALNSLATFPIEQRTVTVFTQMVQDVEIRRALKPLTMEGSYGKLFDNTKDVSGRGNWQVYEMETIMATPAIVPSTLEYLFHRIETKLKFATGPSIIVLDECWLFFDNPAFKDKLREYFKDMRKKNTSIIFATQNLSDVANKPDLLTTVMENCPNRIYLPNVNAQNEANKKLYELFGCNEKKIKIISAMTPKQDYYYSSQKGNRVFSLALQPIEFPFVTATSKTDQQAIDNILSKYNRCDFIEQWLKYKNAAEEWEDFKRYVT